MEFTFGERIKHAWNAFRNREPITNRGEYNYGSYSRPDRVRLTRGNERSIVTSVLNRIAMDVAALKIKHCKTDEQGRFQEEINSGLKDANKSTKNVLFCTIK